MKKQFITFLLMPFFSFSTFSQDNWTKIDDGDAGWTWVDINSDACVSCFNGTAHSTDVAGASAEFTFTGTNIEAYCETWDGGGSFEIFIDGSSKGIFAQNVEPYGGGNKFASISGLSNEQHTVRFVQTSTDWVGIDFIQYTTVESKPQIWATSSVEDSAMSSLNWKLNFEKGAEADIWGNDLWMWTAGNSVEFTFTSTQIRIIGIPVDSTQFTNDGINSTADLFIDGVLIEDNYTGWIQDIADQTDKIIWTSDTLESGNHTIKVQLNGNEIGINAFEYLTEAIEVPALEVTVSGDSPEWGETKDKLTDGDLNTKWGVSASAAWIQFAYKEAKTWNTYSLTSGNDDPTRDLKDWTLQVSNDGLNWDILDTQAGHAPWAERNSTLDFTFTNSTAYLYYKIDITANNGNNGYTQLSEIQFSNETIIETAPEAATGLVATAIHIRLVEVKWDVTEKAVGYTVWRKTGATGIWDEVMEIEGGTIVSFDDTNVEPATEYIYKVVAWNNVGDAPESAEVTATTPSEVGIAGNPADEFSIYPNPATVSITLKTGSIGIVTITDMQGKTILSKKISSGNSIINVEDLSSGIYSISYTANGKSIFQKLVVK